MTRDDLLKRMRERLTRDGLDDMAFLLTRGTVVETLKCLVEGGDQFDDPRDHEACCKLLDEYRDAGGDESPVPVAEELCEWIAGEADDEVSAAAEYVIRNWSKTRRQKKCGASKSKPSTRCVES
jgi:hypothetical protein